MHTLEDSWQDPEGGIQRDLDDVERLGDMAVDHTVTYLNLALTQLGPRENKLRHAYEAFLHQRAAILSLPHDEQGIDLDRLYAYRESIGMANKSLIVLSPDEFAAAREIVGDKREVEPLGSYFSDVDVAVVKRRPALEVLNGPELFESFGIHEAAHASTTPELQVGPAGLPRLWWIATGFQVASRPSRTGFYVNWFDGRNTGFLLEEAYAEYERGQYVTTILHRPYGFLPEAGPWPTISKYYHRAYEKYRYLSRREDGEVAAALPVGAHGAVILEVLIGQDPEILPLLRHCRENAELIPQLVDRMNAIEPGIYDRLNDISNDDPDMYDKAGAIAKPIIYKTRGLSLS